MAKHVIFLVHGMGDYPDKWHEPIAAQLQNLYSTYTELADLPFSEFFEFEPITYNTEFEALRQQWRDSTAALGTAIAASGIDVSVVADLNKIASATNRESFINTHVVDVLLYYFLRQVANTVRATVQNQILTALSNRGKIGSVRWSIIAHSLGTSVIHDALHELYTDASVNPNANFTGVTRPTAIAMIANVSRLLEDGGHFDAYRSRVRPGTDNLAGCLFYLNARHEWDPFTQPKKFAPMSNWPSLEARIAELYVDCQIRDIADVDVHAIERYLENPLVHGPLFNSLHGLPARKGLLDRQTIDNAHAQYVLRLQEAALDAALKKLKTLRLGEEDKWPAILKSWVAMLKL
jgi:hypothetical protein